MLPSASNITMPSAVVSMIAPSSSALAWPTADGGDTATGSANAAAIAVPEKIKASADSPSHAIVCRCASVADGGVCSGEAWVPDIVTGVPVSDVLLTVDTPGST